MTDTLHIRIDSDKKRIVEEQAQKLHISASEYVRKILQDSSSVADHELKQKLACALCRHAQLVNNLDYQAQKAFAQWEESAWLLIW